MLGDWREKAHRKSVVSELASFTLIEVMVACVILALLFAVLLQVTMELNQFIRLSKQIVEPAGQSRVAFDRINRDLEALVKRSDIDFQAHNLSTTQTFSAAVTNNNLVFFSDVTAASTTTVPQAQNRGVSLIAYQIGIVSGQTTPCLIRASMPVSWSAQMDGASSFMGLTANGVPVAMANVVSRFLPASAADYDVLSAGTIRMVVGFQLFPDNQPATLQSPGGSVANALGQIVYNPPIKTLKLADGTSVQYVDLSRISALVIGIVVLNIDNLKLLTPAQVVTLANLFALPADGTLPVSSWAATAANPAAMPSSIPLPARQSVQVFQHFFSIKPVGGANL